MFQSFRLGFATNSSSAHSIILHSDTKFLDMLDGDTIDCIDGYGRDAFSLVDTETKLAYLIWLHDRFGNSGLSAHETMAMAAALPSAVGANLQAIRERMANFETESYASCALCPKGIDLDLWFDFLINAPIAIHGYDDNNAPHFDSVTKQDKAALDIDYMTFKQDGQALVGYNKQNGTKFRWSRTPYTKSTLPELVDLKITDYCGWGCKFCYQGSTKEGAHAPYNRLEKTLRALAKNGVFEVAIGGGEPVEHPDFARLITLCNDINLTLNFTTYGVNWAKDPYHPVVKAMEKTWWRGGIGVSVHSKRDIEKVNTLANNLFKNGARGAQVMAQTVIGATPMAATKAILENCIEADRPLLLLGYKTTGRGKDFAQRRTNRADLKALLERARDHIYAPLEACEYGYIQSRAFTLSVDTAFLDTWGDLLDEVGIPTVLRTSPEGKFSMYVDGVTNMAAPSSYCDTTDYVPWDPEKMESIFAPF